MQNMNTIVYPNSTKAMCLFTDASDLYYGAVLTQVSKEHLNLNLGEQRHEPLAFSSGAFKGPQLRSSVPEKEGYAIVHAVTTFDYFTSF